MNCVIGNLEEYLQIHNHYFSMDIVVVIFLQTCRTIMKEKREHTMRITMTLPTVTEYIERLAELNHNPHSRVCDL